MIIEQALARLYAAGKISGPWMRGMQVTHPATPGGATHGIVIASSYGNGYAVVTVWDGVNVVRYTERPDGWVVAVSRVEPEDEDSLWCADPITHHASPRTWALDLDDSATVGCLEGILEDAVGGFDLFSALAEDGARSWSLYSEIDWDVGVVGPTRGDVVRQALISFSAKLS